MATCLAQHWPRWWLVSISCYHSHQSPSHFLIYTSPKCFVFHVWYVCVFLVYCSDSSYLLWRMTMYFLNCISIVWNQGYHSAFCGLLCYDRCWTKYGPFYTNLAGSENYLNHMLSTFVDSEHEITNFCHSQYVDISEIQSIFQNSPNEFLILTLNIHSPYSKLIRHILS